jgi:prophage regulatory protein
MTNIVMKLPAVQSTTGLSRSTIYAFISQGRFPKPIPLGARSVGWLSSEVDDWINSRISERKAA